MASFASCGNARRCLRCSDQRYAGSRGGAAEIVIERGKGQAFADRQFEVGGVIRAELVSSRQRENLLSEPDSGSMLNRDR
jgi:hypothetical protein